MSKSVKKAKEILQKHKVVRPPVPVNRIAKAMGAVLCFEPFKGADDISGILYRDGDSKIIGINSAHSPTRQRFSIAHEIGHMVLHERDLFVDKVVKVNFRDGTSSLAVDREEIAANAFAAELLMPDKFVRTEIVRLFNKKSVLDSEDLINKLAGTFKVSLQAMEYRLNNLGILTTQ